MKFDLKSIPRIFSVGKNLLIKIKDYGRIFMSLMSKSLFVLIKLKN